MKEHDWGAKDADGVEACIRGGCTVRRVMNCATYWQRKKGGHWRNVVSTHGLPEPIPACRGEETP